MTSLIPLKNGQWTNDPRLDRCKQVDLRSLNYPVQAEASEYANPRSYTWGLGLNLDQGQEGACVGFGWAHEAAARPGVVTGITNEWARQRYWEFQKEDEWSGGAYPGANPFYEGTSVLAGARVLHRLGLFKSYRWALDIWDLIVALGYKGPVVIGVDWYEGMFDTDTGGFIHPTGRIMGGHCVVLISIQIFRNADGTVDLLRSYVIGHNSWGPDWGIYIKGSGGRFKLTLIELLKLLPGGDFCIPEYRAKVAV